MSKKSEPKLPPIYFDWNREKFWMELIPGNYVSLSASDIQSQLKLLGVEDMDVRDNSGLTKGGRMLAVTQRERWIHYAGPLAGYKSGVVTMPSGKRVLVTESCTPVQPGKSKKIPRFEKFLSELVPAQHDYVLAWLKVGWEALVSGDFAPGQLLALAGPAGCGKTFFQWVITQFFGGRSAKPYRYMTGGTQFNEDLAMAEHLPMGDVAASYQITVRKAFASQIKEFCVEPEMSIHGKNKTAITLPTFRRLTISINDEPEHLLIIPPLDSDMANKIMLLKCSEATLNKDRNVNQREFLAELPNLAAYLQDWKIPKSIQDPRFGVKAFHHPDLLKVVSESSPETVLLTIIDDVLWNDPDDDLNLWRGNAEQLKVTLLQSKHCSTISRLLDWPSACGTYLARLKTKFPTRFEQRFTKGKSSWIIRKEA